MVKSSTDTQTDGLDQILDVQTVSDYLQQHNDLEPFKQAIRVYIRTHQQKLLDEVLEAKKTYDTGRTKKPWEEEAVPVTAINTMKEKI